MKTDPLFAALNLADIHWMQIGFLGERFLTHPRPVAVFSNRVAKDFEVLFRARHKHLQKQERAH